MNTPAINIRVANTSDAEQIAICHVVSWQKIYRGHIPNSATSFFRKQSFYQAWRSVR